jgi:uncharacterized delta-60 repeat protein
MWPLSSRKSRPSASARVRPPRYRPRLEALEDRCVPSAGQLDPTFGSGGMVTNPFPQPRGTFGPSAYAGPVIQQADGKIVVGGTSLGTVSGRATGDLFTLARYNANGSLDTSFGTGGTVQTAINGKASALGGLALQPNGQIVAVGWSYDSHGTADLTVARYNANGTLDTTFGGGKHPSGIVQTSIAGSTASNGDAVAIQPDGKIVVAGHSLQSAGTEFAVARYNANGTLDTTFGNGGIALTYPGIQNEGVSLALQSNGDIVLAGLDAGANGMAAVRYTPTGQLDTSFGTGGIATVPSGAPLSASGDFGSGVLVLGNGDIVLAGTGPNGMTLARLSGTGQLDTTFGSAGYALDPAINTADGLGLASNGDLVASGTVSAGTGGNSTGQDQFGVAAFLPGGTLDPSFGSNGTALTSFTNGEDGPALTVQSNGDIVVAGTPWALARFLPSQPQIGSFTASPNPVPALSSLTLTASSITDGNPNSSITQVAFYLDSNNDGTLEPGTDTSLGTATQSSPGVWTLTSANAFGLSAGSYTLFAQAKDSYGVLGSPLALTLTVQ